MTVSSTYSPPQAIGNGTTTSFGFPFQFFNKTDLSVNLFDTSANANVSPVPTINGGGTYDYTVTGTQDANTGEFLNGGNVVFNTAPLGNHRVTITRSVPVVQPIALANNSNFPAKTVEGEFDRLTLIAQQIQALFAGNLLTTPTSDPVGLTLAARPSTQRAGNYLAWDGSGNLIDAAAPISGTVVAGAMVPVVQAASLAVARNLLNIPFSLFANPGATPYAVRAPQDIGTLFSSESMGGAGTFNLPTAASAGAGAVYGFVKRTNNLTVNRAGSDLIQGVGAVTFTSVALTTDGDNFAIESDGTNWKAIAASPGAWAQLGVQQSDPGTLRGYFNGFQITNDGTTPNTVLDTGAGIAIDSTRSVFIKLAATAFKSTGAWALGLGVGGSPIGGLDTGTAAVSTWYNGFAIRRPDTGVVDVAYSINAATVGPTLVTRIPSAFSQFAFLFSFLLDSSGNIVPFRNNADDFFWKTIGNDVNGSALGTTPTNFAVRVPPGRQTRVYWQAGITGPAGNKCAVRVYDPNLADVVLVGAGSDAFTSVGAVAVSATALRAGGGGISYCDASQNLRTVADVAGSSVWLGALGWNESNRRAA